MTTRGEIVQEAVHELSSCRHHEGSSDALRDFRWLCEQAERGIEKQVSILGEAG